MSRSTCRVGTQTARLGQHQADADWFDLLPQRLRQSFGRELGGDGPLADIVWGAAGENSAALPRGSIASAQGSGHLVMLD